MQWESNPQTVQAAFQNPWSWSGTRTERAWSAVWTTSATMTMPIGCFCTNVLLTTCPWVHLGPPRTSWSRWGQYRLRAVVAYRHTVVAMGTIVASRRGRGGDKWLWIWEGSGTVSLSTLPYCTFDLNWPPPNWGQNHRDSWLANQLILWLQGLVQW